MKCGIPRCRSIPGPGEGIQIRKEKGSGLIRICWKCWVKICKKPYGSEGDWGQPLMMRCDCGDCGTARAPRIRKYKKALVKVLEKPQHA